MAIDLEQQVLFASGQGGYHTCRIPALAVTAAGTVLAFCEGRRDSRADSGQIDLLLRRSLDGGRTWSPPQVVASAPGTTCGNPCPVVEHASGTAWLPFCQNRADGPEELICQGKAARTVWLSRSDDDGVSWTEPMEITGSVKAPSWTWYATGPGHGIQLAGGADRDSQTHGEGSAATAVSLGPAALAGAGTATVRQAPPRETRRPRLRGGWWCPATTSSGFTSTGGAIPATPT